MILFVKGIGNLSILFCNVSHSAIFAPYKAMSVNNVRYFLFLSHGLNVHKLIEDFNNK